MRDPSEPNFLSAPGRYEDASPRREIRPGIVLADGRHPETHSDIASPTPQVSSLETATLPSPSGKAGEAEGETWPPLLSPFRRKRHRSSLWQPVASSHRALPPSQDPSIEQLVLRLGNETPPPIVMPEREKRTYREPTLISEGGLARVLDLIEATSRTPACDRVKVLLTIRAGLLPADLAKLTMQALFNDAGEPLDHIAMVRGHGTLTKAWKIPMHWQLRTELPRLRDEFPDAERIAYRRKPNGSVNYQPFWGITYWLGAIYERAGLRGCTSTSGRFTFVDSLRRLGVPDLDIQRLLGYKCLPTGKGRTGARGISAELIHRLGEPE